jgi:hypothetical protein
MFYEAYMTRGKTSMPYCIHSTFFCVCLVYPWHIKESKVENHASTVLFAFHQASCTVTFQFSSWSAEQLHPFQFLHGPRPLLPSTDLSLESGVRNSLKLGCMCSCVFGALCTWAHYDWPVPCPKRYIPSSLYEPLF